MKAKDELLALIDSLRNAVVNNDDELQPQLDMIMYGQSWKQPFTTKAQLKEACRDMQPYYKKHIPEVVSYFANRYGLR